MPLSGETFATVIESLPEHIAVVNAAGSIVATNRAWRKFAADNGAGGHASITVGANYIDACSLAAAQGDAIAAEALRGIQDVMTGRSQRFTLEYPCHGPRIERWFVMTAVSANEECTVLSHADVTRLKQAEMAARASELELQASQAQLAAIASCAPVGLGLIDPDGRWVYKNPALSQITGDLIPSQDPEQSRHWHAFNQNGDNIPPQDWPGARALRGEVVAPGLDFRTEVSGQERWFSVIAAPVGAAAGVPYAVLIFEDITSRKQAEQQLKLLMQEVKHRSKNLLSVVLSMASLTAGADHASFVREFRGRVHALALTQDLLFGGDLAGVQLDQLIRSQLAHFRDQLGDRIMFAGPAVYLEPRAAQTLGVALHELSTNAAKYGALSTPQGRITIAWSVGGNQFTLTWQETGGPNVASPTHMGSGSAVIGAMTRMNLGANVTIDYAPAGLVWKLACALENVSKL